MPAAFALADCNNFYASCERAFNPKLAGRPLVVLSNNDGCVIARSDEAKALGFQMGDPYHLNRDKIRRHGVAVFSSNYALYGDLSRRVMEVYGRFAPEVEVYSIDEAFLNLAGFEGDGLEERALGIRAAVGRWTGIPVSIGIGPTKVLAKAANRVAKKSPDAAGVFDLTDPGRRDAVLQQIAAGDVWGIGRRWAAKLEAAAVHTALDLRRADPSWVRRNLNVVGERLVAELNGVSCLPLELAAPPKKGITVSRSFGEPQTDIEGVRQALTAFVARAGEKLRREGLAAGHVAVFLHTNSFTARRPSYGNAAGLALSSASDYTPEPLAAASRLLDRIFRPGHAYTKCGVMLTDLSPASTARSDLFDARDRGRERRLMEAVDAVNAAHGSGTVIFAGAAAARAGTPRWATRAAMRSPRYTTRWAELPVVRA